MKILINLFLGVMVVVLFSSLFGCSTASAEVFAGLKRDAHTHESLTIECGTNTCRMYDMFRM